ncbi:hypothetical protein GGH12_003130 [Coemansia sp. RSA 1822]|nr:hypothetical protein LPJ76_003026 [Coemansia sp. RSA 638]KAJ2126003.1 hypothetical protein IW147_000475 [Coemansia sp. RSA 720]KAJ2545831.1 hypothetical protein GGF49_000034 [Coemansia sp. RSA 1853]KAJ2562604.1 hypothetical protein GGH12_003130 [Coemansia sp. RSA 1822]
MMMDAHVPVGLPFAPYEQSHTLAVRYTGRRLVDDIAGEDAPQGDCVFVSDLPTPARVVRPGMLWPSNIAFPNNTLIVIVDADNTIIYVGAPNA